MNLRFLLFFFLLTLAAACKQESKDIVWLDMNAADKLSAAQSEKYYFIDVYTEWCGWCKVMDRETFTQPQVVKFMNDNFHTVKFDAESKEAQNFNGKQYTWVNTGRNGINMLAVELLNTNLSYPSYVILDKDKKPLNVINGFLEADAFLSAVKAYEIK